MLRHFLVGRASRPRVSLCRVSVFLVMGVFLFGASHRAQAAETACFLVESGTDCPTATNTITVTPNTAFEIRVVYNPKGGAQISGLTVDFDFPAGIGDPTCTDADASLPNFLGAIEKAASNLKASYFNIAGATSGTSAKFMKCSFPGGADGATGNLTWKIDGAGGTAQAVDAGGAPLPSIQFVNATIKIEQPPCTQTTGASSLTATAKNVSGVATCDLTWTAPTIGQGQCPLTANPFAITKDGTPLTGSPFAAATLTSTVNTGLVFSTTYNFSLVTSTSGGALAAVATTCKPEQGSPPQLTFTPPTSGLKGSPLKVDGSYSDSDSNTVTPTVFYQSGASAPATAPLGRQAQAANGTFSATVPGSAVNDGDDIKFIIRVVDDIGLTKFIPTTITDADIPNATPTPTQLTAAFAKVSCTGAGANCLLGEDITVGTELAFADTNGDSIGDFPIPSEMPFNPADSNEPDANRPGLDIRFAMNAPSRVTARIYTLNGRLIRQLPSSTTFLPNTCDFEQGCNWDGTDFGESTVDYVPNGMYIINIAAVCNSKGDPDGECPDGFKNRNLNLTKGIVVMK